MTDDKENVTARDHKGGGSFASWSVDSTLNEFEMANRP